MHAMHTPSASAGRGHACRSATGWEGGGGHAHLARGGGGDLVPLPGRGAGGASRLLRLPAWGLHTWVRRVKDDVHPAALSPRPHELMGGEPRPHGGVLSRAGVLVLRGQLGLPRGWQYRIPHGFKASTAPAAANWFGGMARDRLPRERHRRCRRG